MRNKKTLKLAITKLLFWEMSVHEIIHSDIIWIRRNQKYITPSPTSLIYVIAICQKTNVKNLPPVHPLIKAYLTCKYIR